MPEMPSLENDMYISPPAMPVANPQAFGQADRAFAQAMGALSDQESAFNRQLIEARRATQASNTMAGLGTQLADIDHKWSLVPDRSQALAGFQTDIAQLQKQSVDTIADPFQREIVQRQFNEEALARADSVGKEAFARESERHVGDLDRNLLSFAEQAAGAPNDQARDVIMRNATASIQGAAAGGWLNPAEAAQRGINFNSTVQEARIRELRNQAYANRDGAALDKLAAQVSDPQSFPGLIPERREMVLQGIESSAYRMDMHNASMQAHADAVATRELARAQAHNEAVLLAETLNGKSVSPAQIQDLADRQQISAGGVEALNAMRDKALEGRDDPLTAMHLWDQAGQRGLDPGTVYGAFQKGLISKNTGVDLIKTIDAQGTKGDSAADRANFQTLKTALSGHAVENGTLWGDDTAKQHAQLAWAQAQAEWNRRTVIGGEDSNAVLADMVARLQPKMLSARWLPATRWGKPNSTQDVMSIAGQLAAGLRSGSVSRSDFVEQGDVLNAWKRYYALQDEAARAAQAARAGRGRPPAAQGGAENVGMAPQ